MIGIQIIDVNATGRGCRAALHCAALKGKTECVKVLIKCCANVEAADKDNMRPLNLASFFGHPKCVEFLLKSNADIKAQG